MCATSIKLWVPHMHELWIDRAVWEFLIEKLSCCCFDFLIYLEYTLFFFLSLLKMIHNNLENYIFLFVYFNRCLWLDLPMVHPGILTHCSWVELWAKGNLSSEAIIPAVNNQDHNRVTFAMSRSMEVMTSSILLLINKKSSLMTVF